MTSLTSSSTNRDLTVHPFTKNLRGLLVVGLLHLCLFGDLVSAALLPSGQALKKPTPAPSTHEGSPSYVESEYSNSLAERTVAREVLLLGLIRELEWAEEGSRIPGNIMMFMMLTRQL